MIESTYVPRGHCLPKNRGGEKFQPLQCQTRGGTAPLPPEIDASAYTVVD